MPSLERLLPEPLLVLQELSSDLHWSWNHASDQLWRRLNAKVWEQTGNPVSVSQLTNGAELERLVANTEFLQELHRLVKAREDYLFEQGWNARTYTNVPESTNAPDASDASEVPNAQLRAQQRGERAARAREPTHSSAAVPALARARCAGRSCHQRRAYSHLGFAKGRCHLDPGL